MLGGFVSKLRSRRVLRKSGIYLASSWLTLEFANFISSKYPFEINATFLLIGIAFGFLIFLIFHWFHGLRTPQPVVRSELLLYLLLAICSITVLWNFPFLSHLEIEDMISEGNRTSVAVIPFDQSSDDPEGSMARINNAIVQGLTQKLARQSEIRVVSKRSAMHFQNTKLNVTEIAKQLRVDKVIYGSIEFINNDISIEFELIDARNDESLWGNKFKVDYENYDAVSNEVIHDISQILGYTIETGEIKPRDDLEVGSNAYVAYRLGLDFLKVGTTEKTKDAINYFSQSIYYDSTYFNSYIELGNALVEFANTGLEPSENLLEAAYSQVNTANRISPNSSRVHALQAALELNTMNDQNVFMKSIEKAIQSNNNNPDAYLYLALYYLKHKKNVEAMKSGLETLRLSPLDHRSLLWVARVFFYIGDSEQAYFLIETLLKSAPENESAIILKATILSDWGIYDPAIDLLQRTKSPLGQWNLAKAYQASGDINKSDSIFNAILRTSNERYINPILVCLANHELDRQSSEDTNLLRALESGAGGINWRLFLQYDPRLSEFRDRNSTVLLAENSW